jgi:hypothetical protein
VRHEVVGIALESGWVDFFEWAVFLHGLKEWKGVTWRESRVDGLPSWPRRGA